jgi:putative copper export protein
MEAPFDFMAISGVGLKLALYLSCLISAGIAFCVVGRVIESERAQSWLTKAVVLAFLASVLSCLRMGHSTFQLGSMDMMAMVWDMQNKAILAIVIGFVALLGARLLPSMLSSGFAFVGAFALTASFALTGHTQALETPGIFPALVAGHVALSAFWFVAPFVLWPSKDLSDDVVLARSEQFGKIAILAVPVLFVGGGILAWKLGGGIAGLTTSTYGLVLGTKLLAATVALGLGAVNKLRVAHALRNNPAAGQVHLQKTLSADAVFFTVALFAVTLATTLFGPPMK